MSAMLASLLAWQPAAVFAQRAERVATPVIDPGHAAREQLTPVERAPIDPVVQDQIEAEVADLEAESTEGVETPEEAPEGATPISLPGAEARTAVSPQAIALPSAEGSVQGMGESFSPHLSSGTATFSVPIRVAPGRAGVQPSLALAYSSTGGNGPVGFGWALSAPFIGRQADRGTPRYVDRPSWHAEEDRFLYNGGQELVPVSSASAAAVDAANGDPLASIDASALPVDVASWQQYRARVEGAFMRFFRSPDSTRWVVQSRDGTRFDFGVLPVGEGPSEVASASTRALEADTEDDVTRISRWLLTRMSDSHGSTVYYSYRSDGGQSYLEDIHYLSPNSCAEADPVSTRRCAQPLSTYGARIHFVYSARPDVFSSFTSGWRIDTALRLVRVEATAWHESGRTLVRRYHLRYDPQAFHSLLSEVMVEGRPDALDTRLGVQVADPAVPEGELGDTIVGRTLPPMRFTYSALPEMGGVVPGFGGLDATVHDVVQSPPVSVDDARAELFDVNSDGLPDLVVTDPSRYRTSDGEPATGVYFNGFDGTDARPAGEAAHFSGAVPMPMRADLAATLRFASPNVVPMDVDGDGRGDLLNMPRARTYGWFAPTRDADPSSAAPEFSPLRQGWRWTYAEIQLPRTDLDPRIDLGRDALSMQTMDVNRDGLIDVVRTTGTVLQTWLNLGFLPDGEGRFGSYSWDGSRWALSTQPFESCLPEDEAPVDFSDPEIRVADMNGDGIGDLVRMRRGRLAYWPGRGILSFGEGTWECGRGEGRGRHVVMSSPPMELNPELGGVFLEDVDMDGAADVAQVRSDSIDVWFNRSGRSFTERLIVRGTPSALGAVSRVRFVDIDGNGTTDVLYGSAGRWQYVDLTGSLRAGARAPRPRMLIGVANGLGASTEIDFEASSRDYLRDLAAAPGCDGVRCDRFTWGVVDGAASQRLCALSGEACDGTVGPHRSAGSPVVSVVVRAVRTSDRMHLVGREEQATETRFEYHDGYYEGIEREFRGFGAADSVSVGDWNHPTSYSRTFFHQGRRAQAIEDDRLADNPDEPLKGREYLTESYDENGVYLTSSHATLAVRDLIEGLDGRWVRYAYVSEANELRYGTTGFEAGAQPITLVDVERQHTTASGLVRSVGQQRVARVRGAQVARLRTTFDSVDNVGDVLQQTAWGRVDLTTGAVDPVVGDERIVSRSVPLLLGDDGQWLWRTASSWVQAEGGPELGREDVVYDASTGDALSSTARVSRAGLPSYRFDGEDASEGGALGIAPMAEHVVASTAFDAWGNALLSCAGATLPDGATLSTAPASCLRVGGVEYDGAFAQLAVREITALSRSGGSWTTVATTGAWDRGLGVLRSATDPNGAVASVLYDGHGRLTAILPTAGMGCPGGAGLVPASRIRYFLTLEPDRVPVSRVETISELDCDAELGEDGGSLASVTFIDALGRPRASLVTGDDEHEWVRSGLGTLDRKGSVRRSYQSDFYDASATDAGQALALPTDASIGYTVTRYDAFGRTIGMHAEDGSVTWTSHHALSSDVCDPLDNTPGVFYGTCSTARMDGHGRVIDQIERNVDPDDNSQEIQRLWSWYRADGSVTHLVRAHTTDEMPRPASPASVTSATPHVRRTFYYDSQGRRIGSDDADTDDPTNPDHGARTWRYHFNRVGDLVAVRDPRGCGQNFFYDVAGRILGEQYVACAEAQTARSERPTATVPAGAIGAAVLGASALVDVRYHYDALPAWVVDATGVTEPTATWALGRATGVEDRGERSAVAYDARGNGVWAARQMAVLPAATALGTITRTRGRPGGAETLPALGNVAYDEVHTYVRTAEFDHANRGTAIVLPSDPDWGAGSAPVIRGELRFGRRGLPVQADVLIGGARQRILEDVEYLRDGLPARTVLGDGTMTRAATETTMAYDIRRRPVRMTTTRVPVGMSSGAGLSAVSVVADQELRWDAASNLTETIDHRIASEWPAGRRPQTVEIEHDGLYHVVRASYSYARPVGESGSGDVGTDWRSEQARVRAASADPMQSEPAAMLSTAASTRVQSLAWDWDYLGNQTEWTDDTHSFLERSIGAITNGVDLTGARPSALYVAADGAAGWLEVEYGRGGNVLSYTAHAECVSTGASCTPNAQSPSWEQAAEVLSCSYSCGREQHYEYRWDELDRLAEGRRWDRTGGGAWTLAVRQRYRYDGANQRTVKETIDADSGVVRTALYVYPGDFERRGVVRSGLEWRALDGEAETQYVVAGARMVWQRDDGSGVASWLRNRRIVVPVGDLLGTTSAALDVVTGELVEASTYYPNGARETYLAADDASDIAAMEPSGFTGKEADEEVGLVYFGERYLIPRVGRWASPDPLHVHASGGGEVMNSYHYVAGHLSQATDSIGLDVNIEEGSSLTPQQAIDALLTSAQLQEVRGQFEVTGERSFAVRGCDSCVPASWTAEQREAFNLLVQASESNQWSIATATVETTLFEGGRQQSALHIDRLADESRYPWRGDPDTRDRTTLRSLVDPRATRATVDGQTVPTPWQMYGIRRDARAAVSGERVGSESSETRGLVVVGVRTRQSTEPTGVTHDRTLRDIGNTIMHELAVHAARIALGLREHGHEGEESRRIIDAVDRFFPDVHAPVRSAPRARVPR